MTSDRFDKSWRRRARVHPCSIACVEEFVRAHYLRKRPAIVTLCLVMTVDFRPVGMVVFAAPPRETDVRYGGKTWELARLYLLDSVPKNGETWLIAQGVRHIRQHHKEVVCLVSYADPSAGHAGTIYRAANWTPDGKTDEGRATPRCDYYDARTGTKYGRKGNMPSGAVVERRPRVSKHRFLLRLKSAAPPAKVVADQPAPTLL